MGYRDFFGSSSSGDPYQDVGLAQSFTNDDMARRVTMLTNHVRKLRQAPTMAYNLAKLPVADDQLVKAARSTGMWDEVRAQRTFLQGMPIQAQLEKWAHYGEEQRALLTRSGYEVPSGDALLKPQGGGPLGWLARNTGGLADKLGVGGPLESLARGDIGGTLERSLPGGEIAAKARDVALGGIAAGASKVVGQHVPVLSDLGQVTGQVTGGVQTGLRLANDPLAAVQHSYRFQRAAEMEHGDAWLFDPTNWDMKEFSHLWEETGARNGEGYFPEQVHQKIAAILPGDRKAQIMVKQLASGMSLADLAGKVAKPGTPEYQQAYFKMAERSGDKDFKEAAKVAELGKTSFGRDLAVGFHMTPGTTLYNTFSGAHDLAFDLLLDPLLTANKVHDAAQMSRAFQVGEVVQGINNARLGEETALRAAYGTGWREAIRTVPYQDLVKQGAGTTGFAQAIVQAFRTRNVVDAAGNTTNALAELTQAVPGTKGAIDPLRKYDSLLRTQNLGTEQARLGRTLSADEIKALPGINHPDDFWNFLNTTEGRKTLIDGAYGGFTREYINLPRLTRVGLVTGPLKTNMEEVIDFARFGKSWTENLSPEEVQLAPGQAPVSVTSAVAALDRPTTPLMEQARQTVGEARIAAAQGDGGAQSYLADLASQVGKSTHPDVLAYAGDLPHLDVEPGMRRLYRVQRGILEPEVLPDHVHPYQAEQMGMTNWWTDSLGHARTTTQNWGPTGQLFTIDVPESMLTDIDTIPGATPHGMSAFPGHEFTIQDPQYLDANQRHVGTVGDWVLVNEKGRLEPARKWLLAPPANLLYALTHRVPETTTLATFGNDFPKQAERMLDMSFDLPSKRRWMQEMLAVEDPASRRDILSASLDHLFYSTGWYQDQEGINEARRYLNGTMQRYALDGVDMQPLGGGMMKRVGLGPQADHANGIMIPGFREMIAQSQRTGLIKRLDGGINSSMVDAFMGSFWKPSVLLRVGFIPRVAGEELLGTMLRIPRVELDNWVLGPLAARQGEPVWMLDKMAGAARFLRQFTSEDFADHIEQLAHAGANRASGWIRGMALNALDYETFNFHRALAEDPYMQSAWGSEFTHVAGGAYAGGPRDDPLIKVFMDPEHETEALVKHGVSTYTEYPKGDPHHLGFLSYETQRHLSDNAYLAGFDASGAYFHDSHLPGLMGAVMGNDTARAGFEHLGLPDPADVVSEIRRVVNTNKEGGEFRNAIRRYHDLTNGAANPDDIVNAERALHDARMMATTPSEKMAVEVIASSPSDVREALLVDEQAILRHLGASPQDSGLTLSAALDGMEPPAEGKTRSFVAAHVNPKDMDPTTLPDARNVAFHDDPHNALDSAFDGQEAGPGFKLYYTDYDARDYEQRRLIEDIAEFDPEAAAQLERERSIPELGETATLGLMNADEEMLSNLKEVPGFSVGSPFDEARQHKMTDLVRRAADGDQVARDELVRENIEQAINNLRTRRSTAFYVRENERSMRSSTGQVAEHPAAEGQTRFYVVLANPDGVAQMHTQDVQGVAKEAQAMAVPPGDYALQMHRADVYGLSKYQPASSYASESRATTDDIVRSLGGDRPDNFAVGYIDVPDADVGRIASGGFGDTELPHWSPADDAPIPPGREGPTRGALPAAPGLPPLYHGTETRIPNDELVHFGGRPEDNLFGGGLYTTDAEHVARHGYMRPEDARNPALYTVEWTGPEAPRVLDLEAPAPDDLRERIRGYVEQQMEGHYDEAARARLGEVLTRDRDVSAGDLMQDATDVVTEHTTNRDAVRAYLAKFRQDVLEPHYDVMRYDGGTRIGGLGQHNAYVWINENNVKLHGVIGELGTETTQAFDRYQRANNEINRLNQISATTVPSAGIDPRIEDLSDLRAYHEATLRDYPDHAPSQRMLADIDAAHQAILRGEPVPENIANQLEEMGMARAETRAYGDEGPGAIDQDLSYYQDEMDNASGVLARLGYDTHNGTDMARLEALMVPKPTVDQTAENIRDWSGKIGQHINQLNTSPVDGRTLHEIGSKAVRKGNYDIQDLVWSGIDQAHLPAQVTAPMYYVDDQNLWDKMVEKGFGYANKYVAAIARKPLFNHNAAKRYTKALELIGPTVQDPEAVRAMVELARSTHAGQAGKLSAYHNTWQQLSRLDPRLTSGRAIEADLEPALADALDKVKVSGASDSLMTQVKSHISSMSGDELATLKKFSDNKALVNKMAIDSSLQGAFADTIPFIHDHKIRSQYSEYMRNITPFFFAEEQMLKRWTRVIAHSPIALRRAQLTYMGIQHAGLVRQNEFGDDVWVVPGSALLTQVVAKGLQAMTGKPYEIPFSVPFTGEVKTTIPGLNEAGAPSFSPLVMVPMTLMGRRFPELEPVNRKVLGEQNVDRSIMDLLMPPTVMRAYQAIFARPDTSAQYTSAMIQVMQYMEANGLSPQPVPVSAGPTAQADYREKVDEYVGRVKNWTRAMLVTRTVLGFLSPSAPQMEVPKNLSPEFQELLQNLPYNDAFGEFMKRHPDATAYTVFSSKAPSGASMPTTPEVGRFLDDNESFVNKHKMAAPWLLPQSARNDSTSLSVYAAQVRMGLRVRQSPQEWLNDLAFAEAAPEYFDSRDSYEQARLAVKDNPVKTKAVDDRWTQWKNEFLNMHPLFQQQVQSRDAHDRRLQVLEDTRAALLDPHRPTIEHQDQLQTMVDNYYAFNDAMASLAGNRTSLATTKRQKIRVSFANWGKAYTSLHRNLGAYWQRNIEPEIGLTPADNLLIEGSG